MKTIAEKTYTIPTVINTTCDICGKVTDGENWSKKEHHYKKTGLFISAGKSYPEEELHDCVSFDICPKCMKKHILPIIKNLRKKP